MPRDDDSLLDLEELTTILRAHEGPPQAKPRPLEPASAAGRRPPRRTRWLRFRLAGVAAAIALLVGSGLGFGVGSSVTPSGNAGTPFDGLGFIPSRGWTVVQTGTVGAAGTASATAANVPLHPDDRLGRVPLRTLQSLPTDGVLIDVTFTTRGDPAKDAKFVARSLPLQLSDALPITSASELVDANRPLGQYRLTAGVGGYNVDARIYYGAVSPSEGTVREAQNQLNRLVVSSERVTIFARPTVITRDSGPAVLSGSIESGRAGDVIDIQARDCGQTFFRGVTGTTTGPGGAWTIPFYAGLATTLRAVWKDNASPEITLRFRPNIRLDKEDGTSFRIGIGARGQFWRKHVRIEERRRNTWKMVKSVVITDTVAPAGQGYVWSTAEFRLSVRRGSLIRAVLPQSEAGPCFLSAASNTVRT